MVPVNEKQNTLDLIQFLNLPVLIAASTKLGTINHSLLTIEALQQKKIPLLGIVFTNTSPQTESDHFIREDNPKIITALGNIPFLGAITYFQNLQEQNRHDIIPEFCPGLEVLKIYQTQHILKNTLPLQKIRINSGDL